MKLFKTADELLAEVGFIKTEQNICRTSYEKVNEECNFTQRLDITFRADGEHLVFSYVKDLNADGYNNVVGLTAKEMKCAIKKIRELDKNGWRK